jgi:sialic acid synthase
MAMGSASMDKPASVEAAREKLERSVATSRPLPAGTQITEADLTLVSPGTGARWSERGRFLGGWTVNDIPARALLTATMLLRADSEDITVTSVRPMGRLP